MADDAQFLTHRPLVLRIAYDITGSWADAEDVAQQAYVRWHGVEQEVTNPRAYLARTAANLALDATARRSRETYVGPWLPEPVPTAPGADESVVLAAETEIALMVVLSALSPLERAAFLLHDVFGFAHTEVATMLGREPAAVRQLASRARKHVEAHRPEAPPDPAELAALTEAFLEAARTGDLQALMHRLTEDAVFIGDGGGKRSAARNPVTGRDKVARLLVGLAKNLVPGSRVEAIVANHRPALAMWLDDELDQVMWLIPRGGTVAQVLCVRNPDKLGAVRG